MDKVQDFFKCKGFEKVCSDFKIPNFLPNSQTPSKVLSLIRLLSNCCPLSLSDRIFPERTIWHQTFLLRLDFNSGDLGRFTRFQVNKFSENMYVCYLFINVELNACLIKYPTPKSRGGLELVLCFCLFFHRSVSVNIRLQSQMRWCSSGMLIIPEDHCLFLIEVKSIYYWQLNIVVIATKKYYKNT